MKTIIQYYYSRVLALDGITYAHKDLIMCSSESFPPHALDTERCLAYGRTEANNLTNTIDKFTKDLKWRYGNLPNHEIEFVNELDNSLPNKDYFSY